MINPGPGRQQQAIAVPAHADKEFGIHAAHKRLVEAARLLEDLTPHCSAGGGDLTVERWWIGVGLERSLDDGMDDPRYLAGSPALEPRRVQRQELGSAADADGGIVKQRRDQVSDHMLVAQH